MLPTIYLLLPLAGFVGAMLLVPHGVPLLLVGGEPVHLLQVL